MDMKWRNMKIGTKLTFGFGIVLILLVAISGYSILRFIETKNLSFDAARDQKNFAFMLAKEIDHLKWMAAVSDLFLKDELTSLTVQTDDHKCGLGKWLYGEEAKKLAEEDKEFAGLLEELKEPHSRLHESAIQIGETYVAFDTSLDAMLAGRWIDHLVWIKNLNNSMLTGVEFKGGLDPQKCAFGKWYYEYNASDPVFGELLKEWEAPHTELHQSAGKIVVAMNGGNLELANKIYLEETAVALGEIASRYEKTMGYIDEAIEKQKQAVEIFHGQTYLALTDTQKVHE